MYAQALRKFGQKIGVRDAAFKETTTECILLENVVAGGLKDLSEQDVRDTVAAFGQALTMRVDIVDGPRALAIEKGQVQDDLAAGLQRIAKSPSAIKLRIDLRIDKNVILNQQGLAELPYHALCYIFGDNLTQLLKQPLPELDRALFTSRDRSTLVFVSDREVHCAGYLLTIVGPKDVAQIKAATGPLSANLRSRIDRYHAAARERLSWLGFQFEHLTPLHFLQTEVGEGDDELGDLLADHTLKLCILYTANRSALNGKRFEATYAGSEETASLDLSARVPISEQADLLPQLALWPHSGGDRDANRLTLLQNSVARELAGDSPRENYRSFVQRLRRILGDARWHHRVFVDQQIDKHFEQVEKVTDFVAGVIKEISQTIDSLTKGMTDALLGAVAVVVLSLLGALVKGDVQEGVIRAAIWVYALYLLLFQGIYRMLSIFHSYRLLLKEVEQRLATFAGQIGPKRVNSIAAPLKTRKAQFWIWFSATIFIYVAVLGLLLWLAYDPRKILAWFGAVIPMAVPTQAAMPTPGP